MKNINKHGIKMADIRRTSAGTRERRDSFVSIYFDVNTGEFVSEEFVGNGWLAAPAGCIHVMDTMHHVTMQGIADATAQAVCIAAYLEGYDPESLGCIENPAEFADWCNSHPEWY